MKKLLIVAALISIPVVYAISQKDCSTTQCSKSVEPKKAATKDENLKKLSDLIFNKEQMSAMMSSLMRQALSQQPNYSEEIAKQITDKLIEKFNSEETVKAFTQLFEKHYNEQEIQDILNFYESPTGKKCLQKMPELAAEGGQIGGKIGQDIMLEIMSKQEAPKEQAS